MVGVRGSYMEVVDLHYRGHCVSPLLPLEKTLCRLYNSLQRYTLHQHFHWMLISFNVLTSEIS